MVAELLVDQLHADGHALVRSLPRAGVGVSVAGWVQFEEGGNWLLYIGTPAVVAGRLTDALRTTYDCLDQVSSSVIDSDMIRLVPPTDPVVRELANIRDRAPVLSGRFRVNRLGDRAAYEVFIYPKQGDMTPREVSRAVFWAITNHPSGVKAASVTFRDGRTITAVPTGLGTVGGQIEVHLRDTSTDRTEAVAADTISDMQFQ